MSGRVMLPVVTTSDTGLPDSAPYWALAMTHILAGPPRIRPAMEAMGSIVKVGYSVFAEQVLMRIGFMLTAIMAADQGTSAMAAHQVGMNIMGLSFSFGDGLQATAVALIGYSLGAKQPEQAKAYGRTCRLIGAIISVLLAITFFFGARWQMELFF